jgi:hypothetical protein
VRWNKTAQDDALETEARRFEELSAKLIQEKNWQALEQLLSPACQFVTGRGSCRRTEAMNLGEVRFKDFKVTPAGDNLIVSFWLSASESIWRQNAIERVPAALERLAAGRGGLAMRCLRRTSIRWEGRGAG